MSKARALPSSHVSNSKPKPNPNPNPNPSYSPELTPPNHPRQPPLTPVELKLSPDTIRLLKWSRQQFARRIDAPRSGTKGGPRPVYDALIRDALLALYPRPWDPTLPRAHPRKVAPLDRMRDLVLTERARSGSSLHQPAWAYDLARHADPGAGRERLRSDIARAQHQQVLDAWLLVEKEAERMPRPIQPTHVDQFLWSPGIA